MSSRYIRTLRNSILADRATTLINMLGLSAGLCCFICSMLYIRYELSYDTAFSEAENIYRISLDSTLPSGRQLNLASNAWPVAELLPQEFVQIEEATRLDARRALLATDRNAQYQDGFRLVDENFFEIFDLPWLQGDPSTALARPDAVVLTESLARLYFGEEDPLGQSVVVDKEYVLVVTGIIANLPANTHLTGSAFGSTTLLRQIFDDPVSFLDNWNYSGLHTYFRLAEGTNISEVRAGLAAFEAKHLESYAGLTNHMRITGLTKIHRMPADRGALKPSLNMSMLFVLSSIALGVLTIACINFVNLTLVRGMSRIREVGVRKTVGAGTKQIVLQFLTETVLLTTASMVLALLLVEMLLPALSQFVDRPLTLSLRDYFFLCTALNLVVGTCAGLYPALRLARLNTALALRSKATLIAGTSNMLRNTLVVFQFTVAIVLLVATVSVWLQMQHMRSVDMGFDREGVVTLQGSPVEGLGNRLDILKGELLQNPYIHSVTASEQTPFKSDLSSVSTRSPDQPEPVEMAQLEVSYDFFSTYDIDLLAGRFFAPDFPSDMAVIDDRLGAETTANFIINASASAAFGWKPADAVGKPFEVFIQDSYIRRGNIVGVVSDSRFEVADTPIRPTVFQLTPSMLSWNYPTLNYVSVELDGANLSNTLQYIDTTWSKVYQDVPVVRNFVDDDFERVYISETKLGDTLGFLSLLALFITCLGLYSLAAFNAERRTKEIGVRKVMGGSIWQIVLLLTNDFSKLVLISNLIAWPVAYFAMNRWLENFAYRIDLSPLIFIGSGLIALCIAWVTVGGTAAKAASRKPVLALRYE